MTHEEMERKKRAILQSLAEGARAESAAPDEDDEEDGDIFVSTVTERDILGGWIDRGWKRALAARCRDGGTRRLLQIARTLLEDETRFFADMEVLFALLGEDGAYLHACVQRCPVQQAPYTALAALILFALLGPEELRRLVDSPREAARYFYII